MQQPAGMARPAEASEFLLLLRQPGQAEGRLLLAVLLDAVALLREHVTGLRPHGARLVADTVRWFTDSGDAAAGGDPAAASLSFGHLCRALGIDAGAFRRALRQELADLGAPELFDPPRARVIPWRVREPAPTPIGAPARRPPSQVRRS